MGLQWCISQVGNGHQSGERRRCGAMGKPQGKAPQRGFQQRSGRRFEEVAKAVGGGYSRLQMLLKLALGVRTRVAGPQAGDVGGVSTPPCTASLPSPTMTRWRQRSSPSTTRMQEMVLQRTTVDSRSPPCRRSEPSQCTGQPLMPLRPPHCGALTNGRRSADVRWMSRRLAIPPPRLPQP